MAHPRWLLWGLAGLLLGAGGAPAAEVSGTQAEVAMSASLPMPPWRARAVLEDPRLWARRSLWLQPWTKEVDVPVPFPLPDAVLYVTAPSAELRAEPLPWARVVMRHWQSEALHVLRAAPWLPEDFVAVFGQGSVIGFLPRQVLTPHKPAHAALRAECLAALARLDVDRAQALAEAMSDLYEDALASDLWRVLLGTESGWQPEELTAPPGELPASGAHVVPGATLYVGAPQLPRTKTRNLTAEADAWLPINTAVLVLDVDGGWARVQAAQPVTRSAVVGRDGKARWRVRLAESELEEAERPEVGYVLARYLEPAPVDPPVLRERARGLREAGSGAEALALLERASAADPWERETQREVLTLAVALERLLPAGRAAMVLAEPEPAPEVVHIEEEGVTEDIAVPVRPEALPVLGEATLHYGCRGDPTRAEVWEESRLELVLDLEEGEAGALPTDACVTAVNAQPPSPPPLYADCVGIPASDMKEEMAEDWARKNQEAKEARQRYEAEEFPAYTARLDRLRERFPQGPYVCVAIQNPGPLARVNLRVQHYALPVAQEDTCEVTVRSFRATDALQVGEVVVPFLEPYSSAQLCVEVASYENVQYGAVLAPDVTAAGRFVTRLAEAEDQERFSEKARALSSLLPHVSVSALFPEECNHACY